MDIIEPTGSSNSEVTFDQNQEFNSTDQEPLSQAQLDIMARELMAQFGPASEVVGRNSVFLLAIARYSQRSESLQIRGILDHLGSMSVPDSWQESVEYDGEVTDVVGSSSVTAETVVNDEESNEEQNSALPGDDMHALITALEKKLGPLPAQDYITMADVFSQYLDHADTQTLSGLVDVVNDYISTLLASGVNIEA